MGAGWAPAGWAAARAGRLGGLTVARGSGPAQLHSTSMMAASLLAASLAAGAAAALLPHPMRPAAGAPGLYCNYVWPSDAGTSPDMEVEHTWTTIPKASSTDGNGVFASSQYWYESYGAACPNRSDHGMSCNSAGYMGSQVMRGGPGGAEKQVFIFSCWDADSAHKVSWTTPMDASGNGCSRFGGEGTGSHCMLTVPATEGVTYKFRVASSGKNATGAMWTGTLTDTSSGKQQEVGTLFYPHLPGKVGFGNFKVQSDDFLEYFLGGTCDGAVTTQVGIAGPFFNGRKTEPSQAHPAYGSSGGCERSDVSACVPGVGCGKPNVLLSGGVKRNNTDQTPLWGPDK